MRPKSQHNHRNKEFEPTLSRGGDMPQNFLAPAAHDKTLEDAGEGAMRASLAKGIPHGYEVGYSLFSINSRMLGHGDPVRVRAGERVLFHILNASATEIRSLALPGHAFNVVALDGNPVPTPVTVPVLWIGTAERVSAIVGCLQRVQLFFCRGRRDELIEKSAIATNEYWLRVYRSCPNFAQ